MSHNIRIIMCNRYNDLNSPKCAHLFISGNLVLTLVVPVFNIMDCVKVLWLKLSKNFGIEFQDKKPFGVFKLR